MSTITLTVFFEDPFWIGLVERQEGGELRAARYVFGSEPAGPEILAFVKRNLVALLDRSSATVAAALVARAPNPKRAAREAARALAKRGGSSQAHEALRLQIEQNKVARKRRAKSAREAEEAYKRMISLQKAKAKRRGR